MKKFIIAIMCVVCVTTAYAENENAATSKEYVDTAIATKQPVIPAEGDNIVITFDSSADDGIGTKPIYDESASYASQQDALVTAATANAAVQMAINGEFYCKEYSTIVENDCWLWGIKEPVAPSRNLFDISKVPNTFGYGSGTNNGDGTVTINADSNNTYYDTGIKLSQLAPGLVVGETYTLSLQGRRYATLGWYNNQGQLSSYEHWYSGASKVITQDMLDAHFAFQAASGKTTIISNVQIESGTIATPYRPYGENTFIPQNVQ